MDTLQKLEKIADLEKRFHLLGCSIYVKNRTRDAEPLGLESTVDYVLECTEYFVTWLIEEGAPEGGYCMHEFVAKDDQDLLRPFVCHNCHQRLASHPLHGK